MLKNPLVKRVLLQVICWSVALAAAGSGLVWLAHRPVFAVHEVEIEVSGHPLRHVGQAQVRSSIPSSLYSSFFTMDLDAVQKAVQHTPWVKTAAIRRVWPNRIVATVTEYDCFAVWNEDKLISPTGEVFTANVAEAEADGPLPGLSGPEGSETEMIARLNDLRMWLAPLKHTPVALEMSARRSWSVQLENEARIHLGIADTRAGLKAKVDRLIVLYPRIVERVGDRIETIDLRYHNGLAVKAARVDKAAAPANQGATHEL